MDYNYINTLISKSFYTGGKIIFGSYDENTVGVTTDGFVMYLIPEKDFIFDKVKLNRAPTDVKRLINTQGYEDAVRSNESIAADKKTLAIFKNDNVEVFVNLKLLKAFDNRTSTYKIKSPQTPVLVYENNILVGFVMPTKHERKV